MINIPMNKIVYLFKFTDKNNLNCTEEHIRVIEEHGYVWFGKIGNRPTERELIELNNSSPNYLILKNRKELYLCQYSSFSDSCIDNVYPTYYDSCLDISKFSLWLKITSILKISDVRDLDNIVLFSNKKNRIVESAERSMNSYFRGIAKESITIHNPV